MRFLSKKRILAGLSLIALLILAVAGGLVVYIRSAEFEERVRHRIINEIEKQTGAAVELKAFKWNFWNQKFRLEDLTLHGLEPPQENPLAHIDSIDVGLNLRTLFEKRLDLFELTITRPAINVIVDRDGHTNIPAPSAEGERKPLEFKVSIDNFNVVDGAAILNDHKVDLEFSLTNLQSMMSYQSAREVLQAHFSYDGIFDRSAELRPSIPYTLSADMDYTRDTVIAHQIVVNAEKSQVKLQGKINNVVSKGIAGKLEYTGNVDVPMLNYFFRNEQFAGTAGVAGFLEFSDGYFFTRGNATSDVVDFEGWRATRITGEYAYHYPDRRLSFRNIKTALINGTVTGNVVVEQLPGPSRVLVDIDYNGVDGAALARAYPWDPKYRIFSRLTGNLNGWFEGKLTNYDFSGHANLSPYTPPDVTGVVALPLEGSTDYRVRPDEANVSNADMRFYSTAIMGSGVIQAKASNLMVAMASSNLKDLAFLYADANGSGTFNGSLTGPISTPLLDGNFTLQNYKYKEWTLQNAQGGVRLDTAAENVQFRGAQITQGQSSAVVDGSVGLSGSPAHLRVQSNHIAGEDLRALLNRNVDGVASGNVLITSLSPIRLEGDVKAQNAAIDNHKVGDVSGHVRYTDPVVEVDQLSVRRDQASAAGNITFNRNTEALKFAARLNNVDVHAFDELGIPDSVKGVIRQADVSGEGTTKQPNAKGTIVFQELSVYGEPFPQARVDVTSMGPKLDLTLSTANTAASNVTLTAQVDTAAAGYPFTARAAFNRYPLERVAGLSEGTILATGAADISGSLTDRSRFRGRGQIQSFEAVIQEQNLRPTKPFNFEFDADRVTITGVTLTGQATQVNLSGTIGLNARAPLNFDVSGRVDLALLSAAYPEWFSNGTMTVEGRVAGTAQNPDLRGVAHLGDATFGRRGFFTSLSKVNGDLFFDQDRITLNNIQGVMGGGTVHAQGAAVLRQQAVQDLNVQIDGKGVRIRYPEGLRTVVDASLVLRGGIASPLLEGNVQIQNLAYRSSFEDFLAMITETGTNRTSTPLDRLRLAVHVEGSRNITIQNQLADVEARIDVDLKGTVENPSLTGHIEASGGTLVFQGNRYRVTRGNIDFIDPLHIEPVVDVQAESEVRDYRIILTVSGRGNRLRLDMRSDPPLPELEIVSLIAGGSTRQELYRPSAQGGTSPTSEQLFQSGAASILFDLLQQRVGNRLGLFGLDRVRIDPFLVGAQNNPGTRITLSEQVTKDLTITYSQDLSSNRQQIFQIEYFVDRNTSIVASRDQFGNLGLDVRLRKRF